MKSILRSAMQNVILQYQRDKFCRLKVDTVFSISRPPGRCWWPWWQQCSRKPWQ